MTPTDFIAFMQGFIAASPDAPTRAQWAAIKAKLALVGVAPFLPAPPLPPLPPSTLFPRTPDVFHPAAPRFMGDDFPAVMPWHLQPVTC